MNITFITFGSHSDYIDAGNRLIQQAKQLNIFTKCILYTSEDLKKDNEFWNTDQKFIEENKRGYGYWLWKPYLIKKTMEKMNHGDILLYLDCGCELSSNYREKKKLLERINTVKTDKILGTTLVYEGYEEKYWNKMDLIEKLDMNKNQYLNTKQRQGGATLYLVCDDTINLINEWHTIGSEYHYIDDSPSILNNVCNFREHRHDQAIYSLLTKKYNLFSDYILDKNTSVYCLRNKTATSKIGH